MERERDEVARLKAEQRRQTGARESVDRDVGRMQAALQTKDQEVAAIQVGLNAKEKELNKLNQQLQAQTLQFTKDKAAFESEMAHWARVVDSEKKRADELQKQLQSLHSAQTASTNELAKKVRFLES